MWRSESRAQNYEMDTHRREEAWRIQLLFTEDVRHECGLRRRAEGLIDQQSVARCSTILRAHPNDKNCIEHFAQTKAKDTRECAKMSILMLPLKEDAIFSRIFL